MPSIEFRGETIGNILQNKKHLKVPINQRSYAWETDHVADLYTDLNIAITKNTDEYFLGTIIAVVSKDGEDVYDGQQRLATSLILVGAIRDYFFAAKDFDTAREIYSQNLSIVDRKSLQSKSRFTLSAEDNAYFFSRIVQNPDDPDRKAVKADPKKISHKRINDAARLAKEHVAEITRNLSSSAKGDLLHRWLDFLEQGARVIWVEVGDEKTAYKVFETMNDRGLKLSAADLLKNYVYSLAAKRQNEVVQKWQAMAAVLESLGKEDSDIVDFIRYYWISSHGHTRSNVLFDQVKKEVAAEHQAVKWVNDLESKAHDYAALLTSSHKEWNSYHLETRGTIDLLRYLGVTQIRPLLLAAFDKFSKKEMEKLLKVSVNWSVRFLISGVPSGNLESYYSKSAKRIYDGAIKNVAELTKDMATVVPDDARFAAALATASVPVASLARYYLRTLQIVEDGMKEPMYVPSDGKAVTLEHILPVNPGNEWKHFNDEEAKIYYNRLGNQALLAATVNSTIGNVGFSVKKKALGASPFSLTKVAASGSNWDIARIIDRQKKLAQLGAKAWPLTVK